MKKKVKRMDGFNDHMFVYLSSTRLKIYARDTEREREREESFFFFSTKD